MKFALIDRILELESHRILAVKSPTLSEDYIHDHFPGFPLMPGVLMLESMYQAASWLVRHVDDFRHSLLVMKEAKNVKYSGLVKPGDQLLIEASLIGRENGTSKLKATCKVAEETVASGRLVLTSQDLCDTDAAAAETDKDIRHHLRSQFRVLAAGAKISDK